jgi:HEAT repeat protein
MKRAFAAILLGSIAGIATGGVEVSLPAQQTLTTIDTIPTADQINQAFHADGSSALQELQLIANDEMAKTGIRMRAIRALAKYCTAPCADSDAAHQSAVAIVRQMTAATADAPMGPNVLLLRAGIEAVGAMAVQTDLDLLVPLLDYGSRDIRAATARALRDLCNRNADPPLRVRFSKEPTEQVRLAISEALRGLSTCGPT